MYCRERECAEKRAETRGGKGKTDGGIWHIHNGEKGHRVGTEDGKEGTERESAGSATWHSVQPLSAEALLKNTEKGHALRRSYSCHWKLFPETPEI